MTTQSLVINLMLFSIILCFYLKLEHSVHLKLLKHVDI